MFAELVPGITEGEYMDRGPTWVTGVFCVVAVIGVVAVVAMSGVPGRRYAIHPIVPAIVILVVGVGGAWASTELRDSRVDAHNDAVDAEFNVAEDEAQAALEEAYGVTFDRIPFFPERGSYLTSDPRVVFPDGHMEICVLSSSDDYLYLDCPSELPKDPAPEGSGD